MKIVGLLILHLHWCQCLTPRWRGIGTNGDGLGKGPNRQVLMAERHHHHDDNDDDAMIVSMRGGAASDDIIKGTKASLSTAADYWKQVGANLVERITKPFTSLTLKLPRFLKSNEDKQMEDLMAELQTTLVLHVNVPNTTVLPQEVIETAAKRSGILGRPLRTETVQEFARNLKRWYDRKGYILHSVTGATLHADTNTAEITVQEPFINNRPVEIIFCKQMVIDDDGSLVSFRQYKDKHTRRDTRGLAQLKKEDLNTTFVTTSGKTSSTRIANALQLHPKTPFLWQGHRWQAIVGAGIFSKVLRATPERMPDGTVQLQILATEAPPRNLEYGLTKSLYTGSWEGEADFQHSNVFGGGECLGVTVKRGTKDAEPSVRLKFSDDNFGLEGGYDVELFSDYIGENLESDGTDEQQKDYDHDALLDRKGATFRLRNPIRTEMIQNSRASACLEQTSTRSGQHEAVGSVTLGLGPFRKELPLDARSHVLGSLMTGTRIADGGETSHYNILPYSSLSATTRQIFPLTPDDQRPLTLALQHSATASTHHLPRHEANALGVASQIRGYSPSSNDRVSSYLVGTTELRIPITLPTNKLRQDASIVVFGDWSFAQKDLQSSFTRKASVGIGLRKGVQGIPIKYDLSYTQDGQFRAFFGLGRDFDV